MNKKHNKTTFSNAPSWYRKKQVVKHEQAERQADVEMREIERISKIAYSFGKV